MTARSRSARTALAVLIGALVVGLSPGTTAAREEPDPHAAVPRATCGPGAHPERGLQGRVTADDIASGYASEPMTCNTELVGRHGTQAGLKVMRFVDRQGNECAFYDTEVTFPLGGALAGQVAPTMESFGTYVLDMNDPTKPVKTATLRTPAMLSPHESLLLNQERGLLVAVMGNAAYYPGIVDVYDVNDDCRNPVLLSSTPTGVLGHESGFSPDGMTYWASSLYGGTLTAVDLTDPANPATLWVGNYFNHGLSISDDGNRAYLASTDGLKILDVSEVQARTADPQVTLVSALTWETLSVPQITWPVTIGGKKYVIEMDEFGSEDMPGAARIIDINDEKNPFVVSNIRLEVHEPEHLEEVRGDPGASNAIGGYAGHYCDIPKRIEPEVLGCTFILSGMRLFDIRDPARPKEIAYFNAPQAAEPLPSGNYAMSNVTFVPERSEVWYSDSQNGFWAVRITNDVWGAGGVGAGVAAAAPAPAAATTPAAPFSSGGELPATGAATPVVAGALLLACAAGVVLRRRRTT